MSRFFQLSSDLYRTIERFNCWVLRVPLEKARPLFFVEVILSELSIGYVQLFGDVLHFEFWPPLFTSGLNSCADFVRCFAFPSGLVLGDSTDHLISGLFDLHHAVGYADLPFMQMAVLFGECPV